MRLAITILVLAFLAPGCTVASSETPPAKPAEEPSAGASLSDLAGTWRLVELTGGKPMPDSVTVTITFDGSSVSGSSGCNVYSGSFTEKKERKIEPGPFAGTQRFCDDESMTVEQAYLRALGLAETWAMDGERVVIRYRLDPRDDREPARWEPRTGTLTFARVP